MMEEHQTAKYISGLKYRIQERVIFHDVFFIDEAHNKVIKIERLQSRAPPFRCLILIEESTSDTGVHPSPTTVDRPLVRQSTNTSASISAATTAVATKSKENLYAKSDIDKCYRCREPGHWSNECPKRKQVNIANYIDEGGVVIEKASDSDYAEEHEDHVACVVQKLLCNQKFSDTTQQHQIFYSKYSIKNNV